MVSSFTSQKTYLELPAAGDYTDTWWIPTNANFSAVDQAMGGTTVVALTSVDVTLTNAQARSLRLRLTGTVTTPVSVKLPATYAGMYLIQNDSIGSAVTIKTSAVGSVGVTTTQGLSTLVFSDGTNVSLADQGEDSKYLPKSGGTMTGHLQLPTDGLTVGADELLVSGGNVSTTGNFTAAGDITAFSDRRAKENIQTITNALKMVNAMRGVRYRRRSDGAEGVGVIAQEMRDVVPEVVHGMDSGMLSVAYPNLVGVLIEAIKELSRRVETLEGRK